MPKRRQRPLAEGRHPKQLYLDQDHILWLEAKAKEQHMSDSEYANELFTWARHTLNLKRKPHG